MSGCLKTPLLHPINAVQIWEWYNTEKLDDGMT
jgi:hypothetical protein